MKNSAWLALLTCLWMACWPLARTRAICRAVEPIEGEGLAFDETTNALWVQSPDRLLDYRCESGVAVVWPEPTEPEPTDSDAGLDDEDAATEMGADAGFEAGLDPDASSSDDPDAGSGDEPDANMEIADAGIAPSDELDASSGPPGRFEPPWQLPEGAFGPGRNRDGHPNTGDAGAAPTEPYCPDGSALLPITGTLVSLVVQPLVAGGSGRAGLVMPVPSRPDVQLAPAGIFQSVLDQVSDAAIVEETEYVQDPSFGWQCYDPHVSAQLQAPRRPMAPSVRGSGAFAAGALVLAAATQSVGCGGDEADGAYYRPGTTNRRTSTETVEGGMVTYETFPEIEGVEITVLQASNAEALVGWMDLHGFAHDAVDDAAFARYVGDGSWFVAIAIDGTSDSGERALPPIAVTFPADEIPITHELQYRPGGGLVLTEALVVAPSRMEVEDGSDETEWAVPIAANGELAGFGLFGAWVTRLSIARAMAERVPDSRLVGTEPVRIEPQGVARRIRVRIPVACTPENGFDSSNCGTSGPSTTREYAVTRRPGPPPDRLTDGWETPSVPSSCYGSSYYGDDEGGGYGCVVAGAAVPVGGLSLSLLLVVFGAARRRRRRHGLD